MKILWALSCGCALLFLVQTVNANRGPDHFTTIAARNAFRLSPPKPESIKDPAPLNRPQLTLQGIATILGHPQALLNIQPSTKATELLQTSFVLAEGESRYDVIILEINVKTETVRVSNLGLEQILTLKR